MALRFTSSVVSCTFFTISSVNWSKPKLRAPLSSTTSLCKPLKTLLRMNSSTEAKKCCSAKAIHSLLAQIFGPMPMNFCTPRCSTKLDTSRYSSASGRPLCKMSLNTNVRCCPLWSGRRFIKSRAMSSELISELYESLMSVQPFSPSFTSNRIATGSSLLIRSPMVYASRPRCRHTVAQIMELHTEASSIKGNE